MYQFLLKRGQLVAFGLGLVLIVLFLLNVFGGLDQFQMLSDDDKAKTTIFNFGLYAAQALVIVCLAAAVLFGIYQTATNPKGALKLLIGLAVVAGLFFLLYSTSQAEGTGKIADLVEKNGISENVSKLISGGIKTTLIVVGLAAVSFVVGEVLNFFK